MDWENNSQVLYWHRYAIDGLQRCMTEWAVNELKIEAGVWSVHAKWHWRPCGLSNPYYLCGLPRAVLDMGYLLKHAFTFESRAEGISLNVYIKKPFRTLVTCKAASECQCHCKWILPLPWTGTSCPLHLPDNFCFGRCEGGTQFARWHIDLKSATKLSLLLTGLLLISLSFKSGDNWCLCSGDDLTWA